MKNTYKSSYFTLNIILVFNLLLILLLITNVQVSIAQSRSAIGFRFGVNKPYADSYKFGVGGGVQANLAINRKWGFEGSINYDRINGDQSVFYSPVEQENISLTEAKSLDLVHLDLAMRYYIIPNFFAKLGPVLYFAGGNDDLSGMGIGGTAALGYQLMLDKRNKLEFVFNTDLINVRNGGNGITPIAGVRVAYAFNFSGL
ncbi:hypothetical protein TH53_20085 [Pedobacter lusitanus]|uniref:Outer membrane protein beta-barrel domain-containing protein n=1 Tax=Pedobacter lusitanus TaxID=1503925 RepID=A0A0D0F1N9_9SPHI|nr:hypothetical protein [Pedobacter lusitanus]KIO75548.1 hypothetical protein TH53_20085 [Pedobacter lusitanus]